MLVKMETYFDGDFWCARGIGEDIFTQGSTLDELFQNIKEAVAAHFGDTSEAITILTLSEVKLADAKAAPS
ncbi:MAG: type II toxin-antitoxin system HicB family antitoxin [Chloroflexi bacterium]|nr:type II toxin-antitoxin system HicB family antitoxin [Chloroflexota bacterium]